MGRLVQTDSGRGDTVDFQRTGLEVMADDGTPLVGLVVLRVIHKRNNGTSGDALDLKDNNADGLIDVTLANDKTTIDALNRLTVDGVYRYAATGTGPRFSGTYKWPTVQTHDNEYSDTVYVPCATGRRALRRCRDLSSETWRECPMLEDVEPDDAGGLLHEASRPRLLIVVAPLSVMLFAAGAVLFGVPGPDPIRRGSGSELIELRDRVNERTKDGFARIDWLRGRVVVPCLRDFSQEEWDIVTPIHEGGCRTASLG
jgi:hypothetical protein